MNPIGIYIHIPFCRSKCLYCDFYSLTDEAFKSEYINRIVEEIYTYKGKNIVADTLFIGGGTPSVLSSEDVRRLISACKEVFCLNGEITMEANPDSVDEKYLKELFQLGINRISFGAQSGIDCELEVLGRRHNASQITDAVNFAKKAGFKNISLDVMLGIPHQTKESLLKTLDFVTNLNPTHISAYILKIEEGTPFYKNHIETLCADEDGTADLYLETVSFLKNHGFNQYEISNFAKKGYECRHNLKYWTCEEYLSFGTAGHSFFEGKRFYHKKSINEYLNDINFAVCPDGNGGDIKEEILLKLRLTEGICLSKIPTYDADIISKRASVYIKNGFMRQENDRLFFTPKGFLVSNTILSTLLNY